MTATFEKTLRVSAGEQPERRILSAHRAMRGMLSLSWKGEGK